LSPSLQDACREGKTTQQAGFTPQGMHSGNSKCLTWPPGVYPISKSCFSGFSQLKGSSKNLTPIYSKNTSPKVLSYRGRGRLAFLVHTEMTVVVLTQLKCKTEGNCCNPAAQEKNNSAEHSPTCTYRRGDLNTRQTEGLIWPKLGITPHVNSLRTQNCPASLSHRIKAQSPPKREGTSAHIPAAWGSASMKPCLLDQGLEGTETEYSRG